MTIGPVIAATLPYLQAQAISMMGDRCTVTRRDPNGKPVLNPVTGTLSGPLPLTVYTGICRVTAKTRFDKVVAAGGEPVTLYRFIVSVPIQDVAFEVDDIVHIDASAFDPAMVGLELRVRQPEFGSQITARRLGCELNAG